MKKITMMVLLVVLIRAVSFAQDDSAAESAAAAAESAAAAEAAAAEAAQAAQSVREATAQAEKIGQSRTSASMSVGPELNMNARQSVAGGMGLGFEKTLSGFLALGLSAAVSWDFENILVIEPSIHLRGYIPGDRKNTGLFIQAEEGVNVIFEEDETLIRFLTGICVGYRIILGEQFYVEPCGRVGWPYVFGFGVSAGVRF